MNTGSTMTIGQQEPAVSDDGLSWFSVASLDELWPGSILSVKVQGRNIAVYRLVSGELRASDNRCTHEDASLADGWLDGGVIECPLHGGRFDLNTGRGLCPPIDKPLEVFPVKVSDGRIAVAIPRGEKR
jgi:nitrite reductase/ring-hydroxylating ferredoxin subunit